MESCDWENVINGLNNLTSLAQNYPEALEHQMHSICETLAKNIKNLRSQVARVACHSASELFSTCKKNLEMVILHFLFFSVFFIIFFIGIRRACSSAATAYSRYQQIST